MAKKLKIDCKKPKRKWRLWGAEESDNPQLLTGTHIEIFNNTKIQIDGCLGVYEYKEEYLKLRLIKGTLILYGNGFNIIYFENRLICITGKISSVEFV